MESLRCAIRKVEVPAHPEEKVRQELLHRMMGSLGYPPGLLLVEAELAGLPHLRLAPMKLPKRRADILCFGKHIHPEHPLYPLLLIECKAVPITPQVFLQVQGYNHYVKSCFLGVANSAEIQTGWWDPKEKRYRYIPFLPSYQELQLSLKKYTTNSK